MTTNSRNIIITGANRGIGLAMVKKFAENGCNIWACARKPNADFAAKMNGLSDEHGVWIKPVYFDLSSEDEIKNGIMNIYSDKQPVQTLINNAGIYIEKLFQMHTMKDIKEIYNINVISLMYVTQLVLKIMAKQKYGNIINIASVTGTTPYMGAVCYGSSKAAVISFSQSLAIEAGALGDIRVNAIAPGHTDTDMVKDRSGKSLKRVLESCVMQRLAQPCEIANVAYFLSSDEASFINGQVIQVDGGKSHG